MSQFQHPESSDVCMFAAFSLVYGRLEAALLIAASLQHRLKHVLSLIMFHLGSVSRPCKYCAVSFTT